MSAFEVLSFLLFFLFSFSLQGGGDSVSGVSIVGIVIFLVIIVCAAAAAHCGLYA